MTAPHEHELLSPDTMVLACTTNAKTRPLISKQSKPIVAVADTVALNVMTEEAPPFTKIRNILDEHGHLDKNIWTLTDSCDLYEAGMNSSASVSVLFAIEDEFGITFPEHMLERDLFRSVSSIHTAVLQMIDMRQDVQEANKVR